MSLHALTTFLRKTFSRFKAVFPAPLQAPFE